MTGDKLPGGQGEAVDERLAFSVNGFISLSLWQTARRAGSRSMQEAALPGLYFTSTPDRDEIYQVGDRVEVYCDHDKNGDRVRNWLEGTVVQVDPKMIAVQFQENVYLTDGWMVPDHVLWCPKDSHNIRRAVRRRRKVRPRPAKTDLE